MSSFFHPVVPSSAVPASDTSQISNVFYPLDWILSLNLWKKKKISPDFSRVLLPILSPPKEFLMLLHRTPLPCFLLFYLYLTLHLNISFHQRARTWGCLHRWAEKAACSAHALSWLSKIQFSSESHTPGYIQLWVCSSNLSSPARFTSWAQLWPSQSFE